MNNAGITRSPRHAGMIALLLLTSALAMLCTACDPTHLLSFEAGYALGRWEATRIEITITERICYADGVQIACPEE